MTKRVSVGEARATLSDLLGAVYYGRERVIIERKGKPVAVVISPDEFERYQQGVNERFAAAVEELRRRNEDKDPDEVLHDVTTVVEEVRAERYEREHPHA